MTSKKRDKTISPEERYEVASDLLRYNLSQKLQTIIGSRVSLDTAWRILSCCILECFNVTQLKGMVWLPHKLGRFEVTENKPTKRRVPNGKLVKIPAKKKFRFRGGKKLEKILNSDS